MNEDNYIKGFNAGYLMQEKSPELYKQLSDGINKDSDFINGLKDGGEQFINDARSTLMKEKADDLDPDKNMLGKSPDISKDRDKDIEK